MLEFEDSIRLNHLLPFIEEKLSTEIWRSNTAGQMQWSRGLYELLGLDPRITTPSSTEFQRRVHPDDRALIRCFAEQVFDRAFDGHFRIIRPNGVLRWIHGQTEVLLDSSGKPESVLGLVRDITEERTLLESLKTEAERYRALAQIAGGSPWIANPAGHTKAIPNARKTPKDHPHIVEEWTDLLHEDDRDAALKEWVVSVETVRPYNVEHRLRQPDGTYRWHRIRAVPLKEMGGGVREWLGICIDMHEQKLSSQYAARLTGMQLRAARGMLNWSVKQLAQRSGISFSVIRRLEEYNGTPPMPDGSIDSLRDTLSNAGIEFLFPLVGKPAVRPR